MEENPHLLVLIQELKAPDVLQVVVFLSAHEDKHARPLVEKQSHLQKPPVHQTGKNPEPVFTLADVLHAALRSEDKREAEMRIRDQEGVKTKEEVEWRNISNDRAAD